MNDAGGGHRRLSEAVAAGFQAVTRGRAVVRIEDLFALDRSSVPYRLSRLYGPTIRRAPWLYGLAYHAVDGRCRSAWLARLGRGRLLPAVAELLRSFAPDLIVTTHPLVNGLVLEAVERTGARTPVVAQVSELVAVHSSWVDPRLTGYALATQEARLAALERGAAAVSVRVLGLPVGPRFGRLDREVERRALGLETQRFTVLALGGGEGAGGLRMAIKALLESELDLQLMVVCGRNAALEERLRQLRPPFPMRVFGYVDDVAALMAAADVVITKGGPQTIAETLASRRPVLVTGTLPGQERGNEWLVQRWGVGSFVPTPARVVASVARLALDEAAYAAMAAAAAQRARPDAATRVAEWALSLVGYPCRAPAS